MIRSLGYHLDPLGHLSREMVGVAATQYLLIKLQEVLETMAGGT